MPSVEYSTETSASLDAVWDFVKEIDNWAPFLTGYQQHEKLNDNESIWLVKGELGGMTRIAEFRVNIIEWAGPERVRFTLEGLQEPVSGQGSFLASDLRNANTEASVPAAPDRSSWFSRLLKRLARFLLGRMAVGVESQPLSDVSREISVPLSRLSFQLELNAGGAVGPVLNLLLAPMLSPVAEDLAVRIVRQVEANRSH